MRCGVHADSYRTVRSMTFVLATGTVIDTAAPDAEAALRRGRARARAGPARDPRRAARRRASWRARRAQVRDQEHDRLPAVRVPRRRHAARDLPAAGRRLGGHARVHRRGGLRHGRARPRTRRSRCAFFEDIDAAVDAVPDARRRGRQRDRADGRADADRGRLEHAGHARALEGAAADVGGAARRVPRPKAPQELDAPRARRRSRSSPRASCSTPTALHARARARSRCSGTCARACRACSRRSARPGVHADHRGRLRAAGARRRGRQGPAGAARRARLPAGRRRATPRPATCTSC